MSRLGLENSTKGKKVEEFGLEANGTLVGLDQWIVTHMGCFSWTSTMCKIGHKRLVGG